MKGIFIPKEFLENEELNITECVVLAIYRYYTIEGNHHCCSLTNKDICKMVKLKNDDNLIRIKKHLKELGYIRTDGGIKVYYLTEKGAADCTGGGDLKDGVGATLKSVTPDLKVGGGDLKDGVGATLKSVTPDLKVAHNKEEKRKKEIKKEEKSEMTNFDLLVSKLPSEYNTPERINYIKDNFLDRLNNADLTEGGILDSWVAGIKMELNKVFPVEYIIEKKEPVSNTIDVL